MGKLKELIAALEAAEGPSRELADATLQAFGCKYDAYKDLWIRPNGDVLLGSCNPLESIDAALSFTPEGAGWTLEQWPKPGEWPAMARVQILRPAGDGGMIAKGSEKGKSAATPAIALCIANLRALEAQEETC